MKILIIVLSHNDDLYSKFYKSQKETWDSINISGIQTLYLFGNHNCDEIIDDKIMVNVPETIVNNSPVNAGHKTIKSFLLTKDFDYDYIFRTNSSSYIDKKLLLDFIKDKPKNKYYSGFLGDYDKIKFASGSGFFLSKDLVEHVIEKSETWDHNLIDDVALAHLLNTYGISPYLNNRVDVSNDSEIPDNYFHYRLKTSDRLDDIRRMYLIDNIKNKI
jgi:hypothetical protein